MLNFNPEQTLKLLARRRRTRPDVARKPWEWPSAAVAGSVAGGTIELQQSQPPSASPSDAASDAGIRDPNTNDGKTIDLTSPHVASYAFDDTPLRRNQRSLERHITDDHYRRSISPGSMVLEGTSAFAVVGGRWGVVSFPDDGTSSAAFFTFERPSEWVTGKLKVTVRYSAPGASTANFRIVIPIVVAKDGTVMTAATLALNSINLLPGPAVADTRLSYSVFSTSNVTREFDEISVKVQRTSGNAADVNVNAFHLYGVRLEFVQSIQEAT